MRRRGRAENVQYILCTCTYTYAANGTSGAQLLSISLLEACVEGELKVSEGDCTYCISEVPTQY